MTMGNKVMGPHINKTGPNILYNVLLAYDVSSIHTPSLSGGAVNLQKVNRGLTLSNREIHSSKCEYKQCKHLGFTWFMN